MYLENIHTFLPAYQNIRRDEFISMIQGIKNYSGLEYKYEKDFLLTLILIRFGEIFPHLVFKGGTCMNKVYFPYFRLSEDLDFVLENIDDLGRAGRKTLLKQYENTITSELQTLGLLLQDMRTKFDEYRLAMFSFEYVSILDNSLQTIKIDISLKNKLQLPSAPLEIHTVFKDPILYEDIFSNHTISCIHLTEALAEKMRAALTRSEPAIRDFFDIWYVKTMGGFDFSSKEFSELLNIKLQEVNYAYTLEDNHSLLVRQIKTDLQPVLTDDFGFNFEEIYYFILSYKI